MRGVCRMLRVTVKFSVRFERPGDVYQYEQPRYRAEFVDSKESP